MKNSTRKAWPIITKALAAVLFTLPAFGGTGASARSHRPLTCTIYQAPNQTLELSTTRVQDVMKMHFSTLAQRQRAHSTLLADGKVILSQGGACKILQDQLTFKTYGLVNNKIEVLNWNHHQLQAKNKRRVKPQIRKIQRRQNQRHQVQRRPVHKHQYKKLVSRRPPIVTATIAASAIQASAGLAPVPRGTTTAELNRLSAKGLLVITSHGLEMKVGTSIQ